MMTWMDRYLYAVTRRLPKAMREDIERELRSNLLDALEERLEGREATEQDVLDLLNEFGDPEKVAAEYMPEKRYLIGPELIDLYWMILKIAGIAVAIGLTIALTISVLQGEPSQKGLIEIIAGYFGTLWSAAISLVGTVTIIFAVIQLTATGQEFSRSKAAEELRQVGEELKDAFDGSNVTGKSKSKTFTDSKASAMSRSWSWSADQLPAIPASSDRVSIPESIISLVFIGIALLIFNVYPDKIGAYFYDSAAAKWVGIPLFNVVILSAYVMFYNFVWILEALLYVRLIQKGRWGFAERMVKILVSLLGLVIFIALIQNPAVLNVEGIKIAINQYGVNLPDLTKLGVLNLRILMVIVVLGTSVEVIKQGYYAIKSKVV